MKLDRGEGKAAIGLGNWEVVNCLHPVISKGACSSGLYISQCMHWLLDNCYQKNKIFHFWEGRFFFFDFIKFTASCIHFYAAFDQKREEMIRWFTSITYFCQTVVAMIPQLAAQNKAG